MAIVQLPSSRRGPVDAPTGGGDNGGVDDTLRADVATLKTDVSTLKTDVATLKCRLDTVLPTLATNSDMHKEFNLQTWRIVGSVIAAVGIGSGIILAGLKFLN